MSADNWAICPKCKQTATKAFEKQKLHAGAAYGKVSPDEYLRLLAAIPQQPALKESLREDYELGILEDGNFYVRYLGECTECAFAFNYKYDQDLLAPK